jgi:DNA gyrase subunit A
LADDLTLPPATPPQTPPPPPAVPEPEGNGDGHDPLNIADELKESYLNYAMSVIVSRALPDVRDGLKPSQRRILVAMNDLNLGPTASTSKCAGIIGETMKRYHPHGDQSIYPTLVRMAQEWNMRHRLVHPQGNFGSIAGLPPAAHRYTEARLTAVGGELLADLEFDTVDYIDSYDGKYREPLVLPCKFPNLLVNGSDGIAVGMATDIPPHNLREVCTALIRLIENPAITIPQLMERISDDDCGIEAPDFPTGGIICGRQGILDGYLTGRGKITLRARADVVEEGRESTIVIREIPYQQTRNRVAEAIGNLVKEDRIQGIREIRDESSARNGEPVRLVIYLKRGADPHLILNQLYQFSPLEKTASIILLALVDGRPRTLTLKQMLEEFLRHRREVIRRRTEHQLREAMRRSHILEGQLIAISSLDEVIQVCRQAASREDAKIQLQAMSVAAAVLERALGADNFQALQRAIGTLAEYHMTEVQAEAVVRMQLGQLARLQRDEILREYGDLREKIRSYETLLGSEENILDVIKKDLAEMRSKYGEERRTEITGEAARVTQEELIPEEENAVTISHNGYLKRLPLNTYRSQHRGGRGVSGGNTRDDDFIEHFFVCSTHAYLLCFTNRGQLYWLRVFTIPEGSRTAAGRSIANVLSLKPEERISSLIPVRNLDAEHSTAEGLHLMMATRRGLIKKTPLADYSRPRAGGVIGINLDEGDDLIGVALVRPGDEVLLCTRNGMAIRFDQGDARPMGRNTRGVKGINLVGDDEVVGMVVADPDGFLLTVCANGYGKRTPFGANIAGSHDAEEEEAEESIHEPGEPGAPATGVVLGEPGASATGEGDSGVSAPGEEADGDGEEVKDRSAMRYRKQRRGGKGVRDVRTTERNGKVVGVSSVRDTDDVMLITSGGMVNRTHVREIRIVGRNTQGVRLMGLRENDRIASLARVAEGEEEPEPEGAPAPEAPPDASPAS